jgi:predicted metal-dependent hydrolase
LRFQQVCDGQFMEEQKGRLPAQARGRRIQWPRIHTKRPTARMSAPPYHPNYVHFFECFNRQQFFEAHEELEALWLPQRQGPNGLFYKGLIQLAGAFVHLQKNRLGPAVALFKLAQANLRRYSPIHEGLAVAGALAMIDDWLCKLNAAETGTNPYAPDRAPQLCLQLPSQCCS